MYIYIDKVKTTKNLVKWLLNKSQEVIYIYQRIPHFSVEDIFKWPEAKEPAWGLLVSWGVLLEHTVPDDTSNFEPHAGATA